MAEDQELESRTGGRSAVPSDPVDAAGCRQNTVQGWLRKAGAVNPAFKSRYFILSSTEATFSYFSGDNAKNLALRGTIPLAKDTKISISEKSSLRFTIKCAGKGRTWVLEASTQESLKDWFSALQKVVQGSSNSLESGALDCDAHRQNVASPPPSPADWDGASPHAGTPPEAGKAAISHALIRSSSRRHSLPQELSMINLHGDRSPLPPPPILSEPGGVLPEATPALEATSGFGQGKRVVWLQVDDEDAWVAASVERKAGSGDLIATRLHAPSGTPLTQSITEAQLSELLPGARLSSCQLSNAYPNLTITLTCHPHLPVFTVSGSLDADVPDLTQLESISTGAVLHILRQRHAQKAIYTAVGPIILALNPFAPSKECTPERLAELSALDDPDALPPHAFNTARSAYTVMARTNGPQSILISGESGAGKTETAKIVMQCLAKLSHSTDHSTSLALESGLLLEAFGNAKTTRNHNSSRFGKWVEVHFSSGTGTIAACRVRSYLLELSRVVRQSSDERNYHVYYQLLAGCAADPSLKDSLLGQPQEVAAVQVAASGYAYTSACPTVAGLDDAAEWQTTLRSMRSLGFEAIVPSMCTVILGILTLGNVSFSSTETAEGTPILCHGVEQAAALLGIPANGLTQALTHRVVQSGRGSMYQVAHTLQQGADTRDALAKAIYASLFERLITGLNEGMRDIEPAGAGRVQTTSDRDKAAQGGGEAFIGLLDIFGFENFAHNSLEQLCINFANEKLQSTFIGALVATQRAEYQEEGITCGSIAFPDNSEQISLLDGRLGVMALLDEECALPKGSEASYVSKMHSRFSTLASYAKPKLRQTNRRPVASREDRAEAASVEFIVRHYAGQVVYSASGWLDKNRGHLPANLSGLLASSTQPFLLSLFTTEASDGSEAETNAGRRIAGSKAASTVVGRFRASLKELFEVLARTSARYIRCLKPNDERSATHFHGAFVERQLLCNGVLAIVEVQAAGYSLSLRKQEFLTRYTCCAKLSPEEAAAIAAALASTNAKVQLAADTDSRIDETCALLLSAAERTIAQADEARGVAPAEPRASSEPTRPGWLAVGDVAFGLTKVFLKEKVVRQLEHARDAVAAVAACTIQTSARVLLSKRVRSNLAKLGRLASDVRNAPGAVEARRLLTVLEQERALAHLGPGATLTVRVYEESVALEAIVQTREEDEAEAVAVAAAAEAAAQAEREAAEKAAAAQAEIQAEAMAREAKAKKEADAKARADEEEERRLNDAPFASGSEPGSTQSQASAAKAALFKTFAAAQAGSAPAAKAPPPRGAGKRQSVTAAARFFTEQIENAAVKPPPPRPTPRRVPWQAKQLALGAYDGPESSVSLRHPVEGRGMDTRAADMQRDANEKVEAAVVDAVVKHESRQTPPRAKPEIAHPVEAEKVQAACAHYRLDMTAVRFGDCQCGRPKAEHDASSLASGRAGPPKANKGNRASAAASLLGGVFNPAMLLPGGPPARASSRIDNDAPDEAGERGVTSSYRLSESEGDDSEAEPEVAPPVDLVANETSLAPAVLPTMARAAAPAGRRRPTRRPGLQ